MRCCCSPRSIRRDLWAKRTVCVRVGRVMWRFDLQFNCGTTWPWVLYRRHHHSIWLVSIALRALLAVKQIRTPHRLVVFIFKREKEEKSSFPRVLFPLLRPGIAEVWTRSLARRASSRCTRRSATAKSCSMWRLFSLIRRMMPSSCRGSGTSVSSTAAADGSSILRIVITILLFFFPFS